VQLVEEKSILVFNSLIINVVFRCFAAVGQVKVPWAAESGETVNNCSKKSCRPFGRKEKNDFLARRFQKPI